MVMSKRNYEVHAKVGAGGDAPARLLTIIDTGTCPNFIYYEELPKVLYRVLRTDRCRTYVAHTVGRYAL